MPISKPQHDPKKTRTQNGASRYRWYISRPKLVRRISYMHEYTEADTLVSVLASYGWHFALSYLPKADSEEVWEAYWTAFKSHYVRPADQIQWIEEIRETVDAFLRQYE